VSRQDNPENQTKPENVWVAIPLSPPERYRLDAVCGPGRKAKRGQWVREAILEKLDRLQTSGESREAAQIGK
jgi:hypothetical protein